MSLDLATCCVKQVNSLRVPLLLKLFIAIALVAWSSFGCQFPERPKRITISNAPPFKPQQSPQFKSFEQALEAVVSVSRDHLALPVVDPVHLNLYKNSLSFAVYGFGYATLPIDVARMSATARNNSIHVDLEKRGEDRGPELLTTLAHEYAHSVNFFIAGREPPGSRWLSEGFAEWVAAKVLAALGWQDYEITRHRAYQELYRFRESLAFNDNEAWTSLFAKPQGRVKTYTLGFAYVDRLIHGNGITAMLQYLRSGDFVQSFGISQGQFIDDFRKDLGIAIQTHSGSSVYARPDWKL